MTSQSPHGSMGHWHAAGRPPGGRASDSWVAEWATLSLGGRIRNCFIREGFTVYDVRHTPDATLLRIRNLGRVSLRVLREAVPFVPESVAGPATPTGRVMHGRGHSTEPCHLSKTIVAIEAEAAQQERDRLNREHDEEHPGFVIECPTCRLLMDPKPKAVAYTTLTHDDWVMADE